MNSPIHLANPAGLLVNLYLNIIQGGPKVVMQTLGFIVRLVKIDETNSL